MKWDGLPLGEVTDAEIARAVGCSKSAPAYARKSRGIVAYGKPSAATLGARIDWGSQPLGKVPDVEIAAALRCSPSAVFLARKRRDIDPLKKTTPRCDPREFEHVLGILSDLEIREKFGLSAYQVAEARRRRGMDSPTRINWSKQGLGKEPDSDIARRTGSTVSAVARARRLRGIPRWTETRRCPCGTEFVTQWKKKVFCSSSCANTHSEFMVRKGMTTDLADCGVAVRSLTRAATRKRRGARDVDEFE